MQKVLVPLLALLISVGAARADFSRDLLAAYFFGGNGDDSSGKGQSAQLVGATFTADRQGQPDGALLLDGEGSYVSTPVSGRRFPVSFSFWFRLDDRPGSRPFSVLDSGIDDAFGHAYVIGSGPDRLNAHLAANFSFAKGVWTHVAVTYGSKLRVYMNGTLAAERDYEENDDFVAGNFQIGRHFGGTDARFFHGAIDDVLIFGRTLTDAEVQQLYQESAVVEQHIKLAAAAKARLAEAAQALASGEAANEVASDAIPSPVLAVVSSGALPNTNGWNAVDDDTNTVWEGAAGEGGWWLAVEYAPPLTLRQLDAVYGEGSATNMTAFYSQDANDWPELQPALEVGPVEARYILLTFPAAASGLTPRVSELRWKP